MQEFYLSRRTITFVNNQAYFRCRQRNWYEELWTDLEPERPRGADIDVITFARDNMDLGIRSVATYTFLFQVLEIYQTRDLTDEADALNAVAGILRRVAASAETRMVQGLPADIFPLAILFLHTGRRAPRRRKQFPSWSWCGWKGEASWYPFDRLDLMNSADEDNEFNEDKELEKALRHNWLTYHITEGTQPSELVWAPTAQQHVGDVNDALDTFRALPALVDADVKVDITSSEPTTPSSAEGPSLRDYTLLTFGTITLHYRLKTIPEGGDEEDYALDAERPTFKEYTSRTYEISGRDDSDCETLYADKKLLLEEDNVMKFFVLGECHNIEFPLEFDSYCESIAEEPVFWVMLIRLIDGVWERRGIGQLLQAAVEDCFEPGARTERIVLG